MKVFTVKDFIQYNSPCFNCEQLISLRVEVCPLNSTKVSKLTPLVTPKSLDIDLRISWNSSLQLKIIHKTNKFVTNDIAQLRRFLKENSIRLVSECDCYTTIRSKFFNFNFEHGFIKSFGLDSESVVVTDNHNMYHLFSFFEKNKSLLVVDSLSKVIPFQSSTQISLPLLPLYRFKSKEHFINKMKTYLIFS